MKTIDFQGIVSLDRPLADQLSNYLKEKETYVSDSILDAIHTISNAPLPPILPYSTEGYIKLGDAIESFSKNIHKVQSSKTPCVAENDWESSARQINQSLWDYVEVIETCSTELFLQLKQIGFEKWNPDLIKVVDSIKELFNHRTDDLMWKIKRIEELLWEYRWICRRKKEKRFLWWKISSLWKPMLDRALTTNLRNNRTYLNTHYQMFQRRYNDYIKLKGKISESAGKFIKYDAFRRMEPASQHSLSYMYELLKIWEMNAKEKILSNQEPVKALRSSFNPEKADALFQEYYAHLSDLLFEQSRHFKQGSSEAYNNEEKRKGAAAKIQGYRTEVHTLGAMVSKYRDFFLRTYPDPYVRARWGFPEWIVGPEPNNARKLLQLVYKIEYLDTLYKDVLEAIKKGPAAFRTEHLTKQYREVQKILHEVGQPLTSKNLMRNKFDRMLKIMHEMDELGSFNHEVVKDTGSIFAKALRADWQYNVLFDSSLFHQLFEIHQRISGEVDDRQHYIRMRQFKSIIKELQGWVATKNTLSHFNEIEADVNDIKIGLQDFLAFCQRSAAEIDDPQQAHERGKDIAKQLLSYRYLFGRFFHELHKGGSEGKMIRNQFLFIDQYFEAVENKLRELDRAE